MIEIGGDEGRLRPELLAGYGFIGFLASWLARHHPLKVMGSLASHSAAIPSAASA